MNIIFAVPDHKNATYQRLSRSISGSSTGTLENNSQNVVALVSSEYEVITFIINDNIHIIINLHKISFHTLHFSSRYPDKLIEN